ncbi:MAG: sugar-binding domain-containing protein [Blastocatellia bacterium]|nr:sugar-binding domain-containing protein [Blastocatellia bacterium]
MARRTDADERLQLILKVAYLYYEKEMTKTDISHEIRASATQVIRLLEEARELGFVRVEFTPPKLHELAERLKARYDWLEEAVVISYADDPGFLRRMLGKAAAEYFESAVTGEATVAIGGGDTMYEMVMALPEQSRDLFLVPAAIIDTGPVLRHIDPTVLLTLLWVRSGRRAGHAHFATGLPMNKPLSRQQLREEYEEFSQRRAVREVLAEMRRADLLFTSLGCLKSDPDYDALAPRPHKSLFESLRVTEAALAKEGVIGDINYSFFDESGRTIPEWNTFPSLGVTQARAMVREGKKVVVTVGNHKLSALRAALAGKLFNVLITDEMAAKELLLVK